MQWILQEFEDTQKLAAMLDRQGIPYTWHKVVPFVGDLQPEPVIPNKNQVVLFGSYTLWRYAQRMDLEPGVFKIAPFVQQDVWHPYLLNGKDALFLTLRDIPLKLPNDGKDWFFRPVDDSKEEPGKVLNSGEIIALAKKVLALDEADIPNGSLRHDTALMMTEPAQIQKEWRIWIVEGKVVTWSLYKEGFRVIYRPEIDDDALAFAQQMAGLHPNYAPAYVMDICRTGDGLKLLETNCINAAGFYAADLSKLVAAIENLNPT